MGLIDKNSEEPFVSPQGDTTVLPAIEASVRRSNTLAVVPGRRLGPPYGPSGTKVYKGCSLRMRDILIGGTIGSVIPGAGTVVGGVGGMVTTAISSLIATCGR